MIIVHEADCEDFAKLLAQDLACKTLQLDIPKFPNGEFKIEPVVSDDSKALIIFSSFGDLNFQLLKLFLILGNLSFKTIDIFLPYIPYSRQDKSETFKSILKVLKFLSVRKIFTIDIHKELEGDPFIVNILPHELFGEKFKDRDLVVVAPDNGAVLRATAFAKHLESDLILIDKVSGNVTNPELARKRKCLVVDDMVDTGRTIKLAEELLKSVGASEIAYCISDYARKNLCEFHKSISEVILKNF